MLEEADDETACNDIIDQSTLDQVSFQDIVVDKWDKILTYTPSLNQVPCSNSPSAHPKPSDHVSLTQPAKVLYSTELLQKLVGFRNMEHILAWMKEVAKDTLVINDLGKDTMQDPDKFATLPKANRNTNPLEKPASNYAVVHYDIIYGLGMAIGGYWCALWHVDHHSQYIHQYPLKSLQ
eukprot:8233214-Ditylum_brightwellii.AAC.2